MVKIEVILKKKNFIEFFLASNWCSWVIRRYQSNDDNTFKLYRSRKDPQMVRIVRIRKYYFEWNFQVEYSIDYECSWRNYRRSSSSISNGSWNIIHGFQSSLIQLKTKQYTIKTIRFPFFSFFFSVINHDDVIIFSFFFVY